MHGRGTYHLLGYHDNRLDGEFPVAVVEQVLQAGAEQVDDQDVVQALLAKVVNIRNAGWAMLAGCRCGVVMRKRRAGGDGGRQGSVHRAWDGGTG